jgi:hypothetical protein
MRADWGTPGNMFLQNQIVLRAETRANFDALARRASSVSTSLWP